ncbi:MAG: macro domain-containing protein [archaeon]
MKITIKKGSITTVEADAIVNPTNMAGSVECSISGHIKKIGGDEIEDEAIQQAPINIGDAVVTSPGILKVKKIIHVPTVEEPSGKTDEHKLKCAVEAALEKAEEKGYDLIAMPGMGIGTEGLSFKAAAKVMIDTIKGFKAEHLKEVILIDMNQEMVDRWNECL